MHKTINHKNIQSWVIQDLDTLSNIPPKVKEIYFGPFFNHTIDKNLIPASTTYMNMGNLYNKLIECNVLPSKLKILYLSSEFNQILIPKSLPETLQELYFGTYYDKPIMPNVFPAGLKKIVFGIGFNHFLDKDVLPKNLEYLELSSEYSQNISNLPKKIKYLKIKVCPGLPHNLTLGPQKTDNFNVIDKSLNLTTLIELEYFSCANININQLSSLKHLKICDLDCDISSLEELETLHIVGTYQQKYIDSLPRNINKIIFNKINSCISNISPNTKIIQVYNFIKEELFNKIKIPFGTDLINYTGETIQL